MSWICTELVSDLPDKDNDLPSEERIKARLRELTEDSRQLRRELENLIHYEPDRTRSFTHDRPHHLRSAARRRKPR